MPARCCCSIPRDATGPCCGFVRVEGGVPCLAISLALQDLKQDGAVWQGRGGVTHTTHYSLPFRYSVVSGESSPHPRPRVCSGWEPTATVTLSQVLETHRSIQCSQCQDTLPPEWAVGVKTDVTANGSDKVTFCGQQSGLL